MNRHIIFGTAGHVDHGKTAFIKHLTGIDTDRLAMEKERGITIENGFAHLILSSGITVGFIDVPGHEKFIKTMLAGAMGMDAVILIIAADEGIKPQTLEHLNIIKHLDVKSGFVLITKVDLVEASSVLTLKEAIGTFVKGSVFELAPILTYSLMQPESKEAIIAMIEKITLQDYVLLNHVASRVHVDRVFTRKGYGTVVTGTLMEGEITLGETLYLYPGAKACRVKGMQVYGQAASTAYFGQRVALNLTLALDAVNKGDVLSSQTAFNPTMIIDIDFMADTQVTHWQRVKLYHGTREILCRVVLPDGVTAEADKRVILQLRLESPIYCKNKDSIVLRSYSPMKILGGGKVVNAHAKKRKSIYVKQEISLEMNEVLEILKESPLLFQYSQALLGHSSLSVEKAYGVLDDLLEQGYVKMLDENNLILNSRFKEISKITMHEVESYHASYPLRIGIPRETLRSKLNRHMHGMHNTTKVFSLLLTVLLKDLNLVEKGVHITSRTFDSVYSEQEKRLKDMVLNKVITHPQHLVPLVELENSPFNKILLKEMLNHLINYEILVKIDDEYVMDIQSYLSCKEKLIQYLSEHAFIEVASFRDVLGYSRKSTVTLLEHYDKIQLTQRIENKRILTKY